MAVEENVHLATLDPGRPLITTGWSQTVWLLLARHTSASLSGPSSYLSYYVCPTYSIEYLIGPKDRGDHKSVTLTSMKICPISYTKR